ncbi:MAG: hypothetical protein ABWY27_14130 [Telluria sp.]
MDASADYANIGRFIYGTARLEGQLEALLRLMGKATAPDAGLTAHAREADAMFGKLAADDTIKSEFSAFMDVLAAQGEQQDAIAARFADISDAELTARNEEIAEATEKLKRFHDIVEGLATREGSDPG